MYHASLSSPFCRMIYEIVSKNRLDGPPSSLKRHRLIEPPQCSPSERAEVVDDFRRRLEAIVAYCDRIGCLPVLIIPPGNDGGFEPSRSVLPPTVGPAERRRVAQAYQAAREAEATDPSRALALYRGLADRHPGFAEAHFRLARLLERAGAWPEANAHYIRARDDDGFLLRVSTPLERAYREVAARHTCILIDGPRELRAMSPHAILDDHIMQDAHHPTLMGQIGLARAVLRALHARREFGWPEGAAPVVEPGECVTHFGLDRAMWLAVCERTKIHYRNLAGTRFDPAERLARAAAYDRAARLIAEGTPPEETGVTGLGLRPAPTPPEGAPPSSSRGSPTGP